MSVVLPTAFDHPTAVAVRSKAFATVTAIATLFAFVGFWPTYFGPILLGTLDARWLIHFHAAAQVSWLALFVIQIYFANTGRIDLHIRFGNWAMALSAVFLLVSLALSFDRFGRLVASGETARGQRLLGGFLREIIIIGAWFIAGWVYRRKPQIHKRIMAVAVVMMIYPAIGRMKFLGDPPSSLAFMLVWPIPIYWMMLREFAKSRTVHLVYVIAILSMLAMRLALSLFRTDTWMSISAWFVPFYQIPTMGN